MAGMTSRTTLLSGKKFSITLDRLCYQLIENHNRFDNTALVGLQPRGVLLGKEIHKRLTAILGKEIDYGMLDITFHRDDFRTHKGPIIPSSVSIDFQIEGRNIVLIDDVLYTGRTIRAGMDALLDFGRASKVELLVLVDRRYSRQLPIEPDYRGLSVDTRASQKVKVNWHEAGEGEDSVYLLSEQE
jgi:pyrimidine operon attenuation protein/uracil phosphoribosyltransferase